MAPCLLPWIDLETSVAESTWKGDLKNGKAVEFFSLCAVISFLEKNQIPITFAESSLQIPDAMYLRNELPLTHGAQPGNSSGQFGLEMFQRFVAAFTPKVEFEYKNRPYGIFREGLPLRDLINFVSDGSVTRLRCDLIVVPGKFGVETDGQILNLLWTDSDFRLDCSIRMVNAPTPSIVKFELVGEVPLSRILVECSVGKPIKSLETQVASYIGPFGIEAGTGIVYSHLQGVVSQTVGYDLHLASLLSEMNSESSYELEKFHHWLEEVFSRT
jgi:hypothetical protein